MSLRKEGLDAHDMVENATTGFVAWQVKNFTRVNFFHFVARVGVAGIAQSVVVQARCVVNDPHRAQIPQVASARCQSSGPCTVFQKPGRIHALATIVGTRLTNSATKRIFLPDRKPTRNCELQCGDSN